MKTTKWPTEDTKMKKIGVLALQGAFREHIAIIDQLGHESIEVKSVDQLSLLDGLILPGGESTAMGKLLDDFDMKDSLIRHIENGLPTWGTCAGMILLANRIEDAGHSHLNIMDITVKRNAYGRQLDSFSTTGYISKVSAGPLPLVFIRAPLVTQVGPSVQILHTVNDEIVAVRENHILATSFHPELTTNHRFHEYFIDMIQ